MPKLKILYLTPHLSTGGAPQFLLKRIQSLQQYKDQLEIFLVEYSQFSDTYIVQRNKIISLLDQAHFFSLGLADQNSRKYQLMDIIRDNNIDIIHAEEMLDGFESFNRIPFDLLNQIYSNDRSWRIVETCHNIWYDPKTNKKLQPEAYSLVTPYHLKNSFRDTPPVKYMTTYPYENKVQDIVEKNIEKIKVREELGLDLFKTHVLNVGLWTSGKNQGEGVEVARTLVESNPEIEFHFIGNQASNFEDHWGPIMKDLPPNVKVWGERDDVDKFMKACDVMMFNSTWECNPLVVREAINYGMKILTRDLPQYMGMFEKFITPISGNVSEIGVQLLKLIQSNKTYVTPNDKNFGKDIFKMYKDVLNLDITKNIPIENEYTINQHYVRNPFFEIRGQSKNNFEIKMYDRDNIIYQNTIPINCWVKLNREYFTECRTQVFENGKLIYENKLNLKNQRVYISFGSKSLGDTLAWVPYCEEFRKKHGCELIVSTFINSLFKDQYPKITFVEPGQLVEDLKAQYQLGWHYTTEGVYDKNKHPFDFKKQPLQKTATDILGLDYEEVRPLLKLPNTPKKKKVGIGFHSTAQSKYWNNPDGWQAVVDHLDALGYECMIYSKEGDGYMNNHYPKGVTIFKGGNLQEVINDLSECEFFIGLGSGLSWLAWACKLPVVLISGFSEKWAETKLDTYRVINESVCHGCFNSDRLDAGDWNWCPLHKNTNRMFECTKEISSDMVIKEINKIINKEVMGEKIDALTEVLTIVLAHPDTEQKVDTLIKTLESIKTKKLLSVNYPIDKKINDLCDYVIYDDQNPLLLKEEFQEYGAEFYWETFDEGEKKIKYFDYEHGYAVYKLINNGLKEAKKNGFDKCHVVNYDYLISDDIFKKHDQCLKTKEAVFYKYKNKSYTQDSFSTGFFSGHINKLIQVFDNYKNKSEYYTHKTRLPILEIITHDIVKDKKLNCEEFYYEDLEETCLLDLIQDNYTSGQQNKFKDFDWGKKSEWYVNAVIKEIFENNTYERFFEVEQGDVVVDLGASLGPFTYKILPKSPKQCYVVEPLSYQIDVLYKNVGRDNVKIIQGAITDKKKIDITWDNISESVPTFTFKEFLDENNIKHIDFLKCDCEGGEYDVFQQSNIEFLKTIPKIVTEFHMRDDDSFNKSKFRWFRDNILPQFNNIQVFSVDGVDIKWDLWNDHFIEYYSEVIIYMDNRK